MALDERPVLLVDNFDSFTHNVEHGLVAAGARVKVRRADTLTEGEAEDLAPRLIVISPGPGRPEDATLSLSLIRRFRGRIPIFGVCLGMQCLAVEGGGTVGRGPEPVHGKVDEILHDGESLFEGLPNPLPVGRYHSLCVTAVPEGYRVTARTRKGVIMGLRHPLLPLAGVQFHPDSFLTRGAEVLFAHIVHGRF